MILSAMMDYNMGTPYIKGAFIQSGPIRQEVYVLPPRYFQRKRGILWRLLKLPYEMTDVGRQWLLQVDNLFLTKAEMSRAQGINQVIRKWDDDKITLIVAKVIDDFLVAGSSREINDFFWKTIERVLREQKFYQGSNSL